MTHFEQQQAKFQKTEYYIPFSEISEHQKESWRKQEQEFIKNEKERHIVAHNKIIDDNPEFIAKMAKLGIILSKI